MRIWKRITNNKKNIYAKSWKIRENYLMVLEKNMFIKWKSEHNRRTKIRKFFNMINRKIKGKFFSFLCKTTKNQIFHEVLRLKSIKSLINSYQKSLKSSSFHMWSKFSQSQKILSLQSTKALYENKITELLKQMLLQRQEFIKEREHNSEREDQIKSLLNDHATKLYKDLCANS